MKGEEKTLFNKKQGSISGCYYDNWLNWSKLL